MKIIIVGCGRLGSELANKFMHDNYRITVIDSDPDAFKRLSKTFRGERVLGHAIDEETLRRAGIDKADGFVAVTGSDNLNIVSARIARGVFFVPRVVSRICDPVRADIYRRLGIATISPTTWAVGKVRALLSHRALDAQLSFGSGEVELVRVAIPPQLFGKTVDSLTIGGELQVVVVTRHGRSFIPTSGTVFSEGDVARVAVTRSGAGRLEEFIGMIG